MLSVWKRTWKAKEPPVNTQQDRLDGPGSSVSILDFTAAAHPSDTVFSASLPPGDSKTKRLYSATDALSEPLRKRLKAYAVELLLPEGVRDRVLETAKRQNIIVILPLGQPSITILVQFLVFAIESERLRLNTVTARRRTALIVVNDDSALDSYDASIRLVAPHISIAKYDVVGGNAEADPWAILLRQDVVILTSTSLLESLICGTLAMTQLHAITFSDIRKKGGGMMAPVLRLMNEFYLVADRLSRPRVFGFASLFAGSGDTVELVTNQIEATMDSKVFDLTTPTRTTHPSHLAFQNEAILLYDKATQPTVPTLLKELQLLISSHTCFEKHFRDSRDVLDELGPCASDLVWRRALKEFDTLRVSEDNAEGNSLTDVQIGMRDLIKDWTFVMPNLDPSSRGFNVSHKFSTLVKILESCEPYGESFRGVVFVRKGIMALAVADLLRKLDDQLGFLRPIALSGIECQGISQTLAAGVYNLLIIPELENGVDVVKVPIIICFDVFERLSRNSLFSYAHETHLIHMVERKPGSCPQGPPRLNADVLPSTSAICGGPQIAVSQSALRLAYEHLAADEEQSDQPRFIEDPTTGSRIYLHNCVEIVERFASSGRPDHAKSVKTLFRFEEQQREWPGSPSTIVCTAILPDLSKVTGPPCTSTEDAKRAVCYRVCQNLASTGLLDCRLFPPPPKSAVNFTNADGISADSKSTGQRRYARKEPDFWTNTRDVPIRSLYPIIISTTHTDGDMQPYAPIVILTRQPLPDLANFNVFYSGVPANICMERGAPIRLEEARVHDLYLYTLRTCRMITNKYFECTLANMVYFLAPLTTEWTPSYDDTFNHPLGLPSIAEYIPWELVSLAGNSYSIPLQQGATVEEAQREFKDAVIQDRPVEFTKRYAAVRLRPDLSPLSKPEDSPREAAYDSVLAFCQARRKGFEGLQDENQPLIEVSPLPSVLNRLNPTSRPSPSTKIQAKYLIPELCSKSTIPASTMRTARLLPSITRRIDDLLLVKELNARLFDHAISDKLLHMALCTPSCGVEYDYERLELLGDAFLKYVTSIYVFVAHPTRTEGDLHVARQDLISNKSLFNHACRIGLPSYIQSKLFSPRLWVPPNFTLPSPKNRAAEDRFFNLEEEPEARPVEPSSSSILTTFEQQMEITNNDPSASEKKKQSKEHRKTRRKWDHTMHWLGDKAVADVAEALIGAGYVTGGRELGLKVSRALGIPISDIHAWTDLVKMAASPPPSSVPKLRPGSIERVEDIIGYQIEQPHVLAHALMHPSIHGHNSTVSQRLEFVGDAILDFMVISHLYDREQHLTPGGLTLLKGAMVSNSALAAVCVCSGLYEYFHHKSHALQTSIREYATKIKTSQTKEYQDAEFEGRPPGQFWLDISAPKALSDIVEAIMGTIYIADNFSSVGVETVFEKLLKPFYDKHITLKTLSQHPTKLLFELFQRQGCRRFTTSIERKENKANLNNAHILVHEVILASAEDPDPTIAARRASFFALDALEGDSGFFARTCDCRSSPAGVSRKELEANTMSIRQILKEDSQIVQRAEDLDHESDLEEGMILE
ncbi:hypothetical protein D9615_000336 [Tricholomella constricta]|uniref:Dicer-like protein 1 n=1 Tax=Tricholomella constricta TaxID=117010 RepID=A0A8H5HQP3_9AGAR|nr:hypothetical protein D9615_000336 [Tricholomella constricta]